MPKVLIDFHPLQASITPQRGDGGEDYPGTLPDSCLTRYAYASNPVEGV